MEGPTTVSKVGDSNTYAEKSIHSANTEAIDDAHLEKNSHSANEEAVEVYGDVRAAEHYGYVKRGLKARHVQFIALGGSIGTGLFLGIGRALVGAGPLSLFLGYVIVGVAVYMMLMSLGEMATWLPLPGAIPQICARYVDDALGFAVGWNSWYAMAIALCAEISAAATVIQYWRGAADINPAAWISIIIVLILALNLMPVKYYGEAEFVFASIKVVTIVGLLILAFILDLGGGPNHDRLGFRYWKDPGAMKTYIADGNTGRFLGLWSTFINAAFSYSAIEMVVVTAGEAQDPRRNIPKAVRRVFWRILVFYVFGSLAIGVLVPSNDPNLLSAIKSHSAGAARSPWVIAIQRAGISALPSIINTVILSSAASSANGTLYIGSRYLFALAQNQQAPRFLLKCTNRGVPYWCVLITASITGLTYLSCGSAGAATAFTWFQNLTTVSILFIWVSACIAYVRFHGALKVQNIGADQIYFRAPFQPYSAWIALVFFSLIILFNGFDTIAGGFSAQGFVAAYIGVPIYFGLFVFWKFFKRTKMHSLAGMDLFTGKAALDNMEWPVVVPRNFLERVWFWLC